MDGLTHSLVGLTLAKAGLERLSPYTAATCILSANAPDIDVVSFFFGDRWTLLQHHRGFTHSIIGTLALGLLIPSVLFGIERAISLWRKRRPQILYRGLVLASLIAAATHPLMDWMNNYGVRPLLPWSGRWFYGDLIFIVDPYLYLILGGAAFILTSNRRAKTILWALLGFLLTIVVLRVTPQRSANGGGLLVARIIWVAGILALMFARWLGLQRRINRSLALGALALVLIYWSGLAWAHHAAFLNASAEAEAIAAQRGEHLLRVAAMPTAANPFQWLCIGETDRAMYRFFVSVKNQAPPANDHSGTSEEVERYEKPVGQTERLVLTAASDRRAKIFLGFARFPIARVENENCGGQTLVQFADLRYTEPGISRGTFALEVAVKCPAP
jgi:inner membrane protein